LKREERHDTPSGEAAMSKLTRRRLLRSSALAGIGLFTLGRPGRSWGQSPNEKLDIAVVGCAGRGAADLAGVSSENIVALCDVDEAHAAKSFAAYPQARKFTDFRRMLDQIHNQIDAVVVATPDHTHAPAGAAAMRLGKHCYCEKPMTHDVFEARTMTELAREHKLATHLGTQIHAGANYRRAVELVRAGAIGPVEEVHVWLGANFDGPPKPAGANQPDAPTDSPSVPETLDWDLWLGPAPERPYSPEYVPFRWRYWWAFGNGQLGDFFCHYCDLAFWALDLRYPTTVEAEGPVHPESTARWTVARQKYPARGQEPAVVLNWYSGGAYPPLVKERNVPRWGSAVLFIGSEGMLIADYGRHQLLPESKFAGFQPPEPTIPDSIGHHQEWIVACKTGSPTTCNFGYSGPLTEAALLCNVALRTGQKLQWDAEGLKAVGCPEAEPYLRREYRKGWTL
jgi:predicted dehydrogenase